MLLLALASLGVSPDQFDIETRDNMVIERQLTLFNTEAEEVNYSFDAPEWVHVLPRSGTIPPRSEQKISLTFWPDKDEEDEITVRYNNKGNIKLGAKIPIKATVTSSDPSKLLGFSIVMGIVLIGLALFFAVNRKKELPVDFVSADEL